MIAEFYPNLHFFATNWSTFMQNPTQNKQIEHNFNESSAIKNFMMTLHQTDQTKTIDSLFEYKFYKKFKQIWDKDQRKTFKNWWETENIL